MARPEVFKTPLGQRLREVRKRLGDPDREAFAATLGVTARALSTYERGDNEPATSVLSAYRDVHGVNLNWLLRGTDDEPIFAVSQEAPASAQQIDAMKHALDAVGRVVRRVYESEGVKLAPAALVAEFTRWSVELIRKTNDLTDIEEIDSLLPWLERRIAKELQSAKAAPGTGKRSA